MAANPAACADRVHTAGTRSSLSQLGPVGMMSFKGSGPGGCEETDMCSYLALPHIYRGTARSKTMALWRRGGGGADELLSVLERRMIRRPGEEEEGEEGRSWTGAEREICALHSQHRRLGGNAEKGREKERKRIGEIFPPVAEEIRESRKGRLCVEKWTKPFPGGGR